MASYLSRRFFIVKTGLGISANLPIGQEMRGRFEDVPIYKDKNESGK
ncbi:hypothetical protein HYU06_05285 [Candidatus Woesearchaeota archaeon]|nr:hypothetical protein [Candidatus Woesearchaeota archaeon]